MRVGFDAKRVFHNFRGLGNYGRNLLEGMEKYFPDYQFVLYTPQFNDQRALEWTKKNPNFEIVRPSNMMTQTFSSVWRSFSINGKLKNDGIDLYHGLSHELPAGIGKNSIPSIVTIHDLIFLRYPQFFPWIDRKVYLSKIKYACDASDVVLSICEQTKIDLMEFLKIPKDKIKIIHQSCDPIYYNPIGEAERTAVLDKYGLGRPYVLFVGALEERKNALTLVKAFNRIKDKVDHDLYLIGNGKEYKKKIKKLITERGLSDRVKILDNIPTHELPSFYQSADLFVYPSLFEGFGIPIIEALFSECPVITSRGSCFPEAGGPNTRYVNPRDAEEMASEIETVLLDREKALSMARQGRKFVESFHRKEVAQKLSDLYSSLLN